MIKYYIQLGDAQVSPISNTAAYYRYHIIEVELWGKL